MSCDVLQQEYSLDLNCRDAHSTYEMIFIKNDISQPWQLQAPVNMECKIGYESGHFEFPSIIATMDELVSTSSFNAMIENSFLEISTKKNIEGNTLLFHCIFKNNEDVINVYQPYQIKQSVIPNQFSHFPTPLIQNIKQLIHKNRQDYWVKLTEGNTTKITSEYIYFLSSLKNSGHRLGSALLQQVQRSALSPSFGLAENYRKHTQADYIQALRFSLDLFKHLKQKNTSIDLQPNQMLANASENIQSKYRELSYLHHEIKSLLYHYKSYVTTYDLEAPQKLEDTSLQLIDEDLRTIIQDATDRRDLQNKLKAFEERFIDHGRDVYAIRSLDKKFVFKILAGDRTALDSKKIIQDFLNSTEFLQNKGYKIPQSSPGYEIVKTSLGFDIYITKVEFIKGISLYELRKTLSLQDRQLLDGSFRKYVFEPASSLLFNNLQLLLDPTSSNFIFTGDTNDVIALLQDIPDTQIVTTLNIHGANEMKVTYGFNQTQIDDLIQQLPEICENPENEQMRVFCDNIIRYPKEKPTTWINAMKKKIVFIDPV
ncbi:MAG: hypothetical protein R3A45_05430 [Bdellovibrionota bacterium]